MISEHSPVPSESRRARGRSAGLVQVFFRIVSTVEMEPTKITVYTCILRAISVIPHEACVVCRKILILGRFNFELTQLKTRHQEFSAPFEAAHACIRPERLTT